MAATNFQVELPNTLPGGGQVVRLVNKPSQLPCLGFTVGSVDDTYPSSGTPAAPSNGIGSISVSSGIIDTTFDQDRYIWTAPAPCIVVAIFFQQVAIENTSAACTLQIRKCATGIALASGTGLLGTAGATPVNLKTGVVADTVLSATLNTSAAALTFAATDSIGLDFTTAITEYAGCVTVWLNFI